MDDFERDEADPYYGRTRILNVKEKGMTVCYILNRCLVMFCAVLMKHRCKVKSEQVITLQMAQQLKTKNINVAQGQLFYRQAKLFFSVKLNSC